jgi:formylglycine-generating enzyme required for sulfatase activity
LSRPKPVLTGTTHTLPFGQLSPRDFERLCLWLVEREGYERAEHLGAAGSEQGRDVIAHRDTPTGEELWYFQCKRYRTIGATTLKEEVDKYLKLAKKRTHLKPHGAVFVVSCDVSARVREDVGDYCDEYRLAYEFWALTELDEKVRRHPDIVDTFFQMGRGDIVTIIYQGAEISIPSSEAIAKHRAALREQLARDTLARWGEKSVYIEEEGTPLPIEAFSHQIGRQGSRENLLDTLRAAGRLLVLGGPGSGKTVTLERLAWELCDGDEPTVPVLVRLFHYAGSSLSKWVVSLLRRTGHLRLDSDQELEAFLQEWKGRLFFLFDGLNEVSSEYRDRLTEEVVLWAASYPRHPLILTSRRQDELWRRLRAEMDRVVMIQPVRDEKAKAYLVDHLGQKGAFLYEGLGERLQELARTPLLLRLILEAGAAGESVPSNRGELYARFVSRMLQRDTERRMDSQISEQIKQQSLSQIAYCQHQDHRLSCDRSEAIAMVAQLLEAFQAEAVVDACLRHGLLAGERTVWFAPHQTVQEHFAALALQEWVKREKGRGWGQRAWHSLRHGLIRKDDSLVRLAAEDWWMETFVQLAGLVDDADWLAREVARTNPWLALWCIEDGQEVSEETREAVADRSERLLDSKRVSDRRRAVASLTKMQSRRVLQPLFRAAADSNDEIRRLAVQALVEAGEPARVEALALARQPARRLHQSGLAYMQASLGLPVVWVPPGPFLMGSDKNKDRRAQDNESPQHTVTLPGYWIGQYPVTVAQFWAFVAESGYRLDSELSRRGPVDYPVAYVNWYEAMAYCDWLTDRSATLVTLPSEAEWEKASRGTAGIIYPWGNRWDPNRCNTIESGFEDTTPADRYPQGASPYGCLDMAGNVWEWTRSLWGKDSDKTGYKYPYNTNDGRESLDVPSSVGRVLRGGSWYHSRACARCAYRGGRYPDLRRYDVGFRVVVSPIP